MAGVGHVLAKDHDARITLHLVLQAGVDQVGHGAFLRVRRLHRRLGQIFPRGVQVFGIDMPLDGTDLRQRRAQHPVGGAPHLFVDLLFQPVDGRRIENAVAQQAHLQLGQRIQSSFPLALRLRPVEPFVVGKGMRIRPDYMPMHKGRTLAGSGNAPPPG